MAYVRREREREREREGEREREREGGGERGEREQCAVDQKIARYHLGDS